MARSGARTGLLCKTLFCSLYPIANLVGERKSLPIVGSILLCGENCRGARSLEYDSKGWACRAACPLRVCSGAGWARRVVVWATRRSLAVLGGAGGMRGSYRMAARCGVDFGSRCVRSGPEPRRSYKVGRLVKAVWNAAPQRVMAP
jgi:hypothetical protein